MERHFKEFETLKMVFSIEKKSLSHRVTPIIWDSLIGRRKTRIGTSVVIRSKVHAEPHLLVNAVPELHRVGHP
jgi:hypothetical protein